MLSATTLHENVDGSLILIHHTPAMLLWLLNGAGFLVDAPGVIPVVLSVLLKKAASGVLVIFPCSRTGGTLCAQK